MDKNWNLTVILLVIIAIVSIFYTGYKFSNNDSVVYVPLINYYKDNSLYPKDILVENLRLIYSPAEFLFKVFFKYIDIEWFLFISLIISRILLVFSIFMFSYLVFKNKIVSFLSVIFLIGVKGTLLNLGNMKLLDNTISPWYFALPISIFSLYYFLKDKYIISFILIASISYLNILVSLYLIFMYSVYFLYKLLIKKNKENDVKISKLVLPYLLFIALSFPMLYKSLAIQNSAINLELWTDFLKLRLSHHIFPSLWPIYQYILFGILLLLFGFSLNYKPITKYNNKLIAFLFGILILGLIGIIFTEFYPMQIIMTATLFRSFVFLKVIMIVYISNCLVKFYNADFKKILSIKSLVFFSAILFFSALIILPGFLGRDKGFIYEIDVPGISSVTSDFEDAAYWASKNTPKDSLFVTPPLYTGFNAFSMRSNLIDWKTAGNFLYNPSLSRTAIERISDICKSYNFKIDAIDYIRDCENNYNSMTESDFLYLKNKYGINYIVVEKQLSFQLLYTNSKFKVYKI